MTKQALLSLGLCGLLGWFALHTLLPHYGRLPIAYAQADPGPTVVTHHETIPNPVYGSAQRIAVHCKGIQTPCDWADPATWSTGVLPDGDSRVIVDGNVQINDETAIALAVGIYPGGQLRFNPTANTQLQSGDLVVFGGGILQIGTASQPIDAAVTAQVILRDQPFVNDPKQHLRGIVVVDGTFTIHGHPLVEPFIRTATEPQPGATTITVAHSAIAAGWRVGDAVVLPQSSQCAIATTQGTCPDETEDHTIAAIADDGLSITLAEPVQFQHPGARNNRGQIDFLPHLLNKSRNVIIRTETPNGVRGHILLHGRATVDLRYASLQDLGRTDIRDLGDDNQKGRYPLHAHHLIGPVTPPANGYQYTLVGNVIDFGVENREQNRKWGIAIHDSHFGLVAQNIVDYASGAGFVTEDGSETGNLIRRNFVVRVIGGNNERTEDRDPGDNSKLGRAGVAYWFNGGGGNQIVENIAAAVVECTSCYGFKFDNVYNGDVMLPTAQGADPHAGGGVMTNSYTIGLTNFVRNEAYAVPNGLTIWWVCTDYETPIDSCSSTVHEFRVWHNHRWGYFAYETNQMTLDRFTHRGDATLLANPYESLIGLYLVDYFQRRTVIRNADIQGVATAIEAPVHRDIRGSSGSDVGMTVIEDSLLIAGTGIYITSPSSTNGAADLAPQTTLIRNVQFDHPATRPGDDIVITGDGASSATSNNQALRNEVWVINYNRAPGASGDNLYIVPTYQEASRCDATLGDCNNEISANYPVITGGRIYPLADSAVPTPAPTLAPTPSSTPAPTGTALPAGPERLYLPVITR
ncbi:MAG: G8 domain-containing protein [Caldilineaceae bacterium]